MLLEERLREPCECFLSSGYDLVSDVWWCAPGSVWMIVFLSSHLWSERQVTDMTQSSIQLHFCSSALLLPLAVSYCSHFHFSTHLKPVFSRRTFITYIDPKNKTSSIFSRHKRHAWVSVCLNQLVFSGCMKLTRTFVHLYCNWNDSQWDADVIVVFDLLVTDQRWSCCIWAEVKYCHVV